MPAFISLSFFPSVDANFISLDLRPSNICNFKCRTCNDGFSTKWQEEKEDFYKINENVLYFGKEKLSGVNKVNFKLNEASMKNIEILYFAGGEPFVLEEHFELLESIKEKKHTEIKGIHRNRPIHTETPTEKYEDEYAEEYAAALK